MVIGFLAFITATTLEPNQPTLEQKVVFVISATLVVIVLLQITQAWLYLSRGVPEGSSVDCRADAFQDSVHGEEVDAAARKSPSEY
jgi:hypothetical protein